MMSPSFLKSFLKRHQGEVEFLGLRSVFEKNNSTWVRNETLESTRLESSGGLMVEVMIEGHLGYSATCDLSEPGIERAFALALEQTRKATRHKAFSFPKSVRPVTEGKFVSARKTSLDDLKVSDAVDALIKISQALKTSERIVSRKSGALLLNSKTIYITSEGTEIEQDTSRVMLDASATAQNDTEFQSRSLNGRGARTFQMGAEVFSNPDLFEDCRRAGEQALELSMSENCPADTMDLLIHPDQMMIQIHESIGHPLEMDRILGDERNFAGWSFVKMSDFGTLKYGSDLMNITFDPHVSGEAASYSFDDGGKKAEREFLIQNGVLKRGLGAAESQIRSGQPGVANFRAASWNRAPIDRMANINLEPGTDKVEAIIQSIHKGIFVRSNKSWSIDDYRNKFQFGCEYAQLIENGKLTKTVKNSNYRGTTLNFWRNLAKVSDVAEPFTALYCGKGEPSQVVQVGHKSPHCLFQAVEVFGA